MKVGFVGLGKLGLPCAVGMALKGHDVVGYDENPALMNNAPRSYRESGPDGKLDFNDYLAKSTVRFGSLQEVADHSEIIFVAVQTPHDAPFEGITRIPSERKDFNYSYLIDAARALAFVIRKETIVVIISTVLPGTVRRDIAPILTPLMKLCYNPYFIAMGTTMPDFLNPEFVLLGSEHEDALRTVKEFYGTIHQAQIYTTSIENAELIKVAYNTFIGMKIAFANTIMEICHHLPNTDADAVSRGLSLGTQRLLSDRYLYGGMGDGGGCHPRDNIALSWLAQQVGLSYDWFENVMLARERQTEWLAELMIQYAHEYSLPLAILGYAFKAESNITVGSPALLLKNLLEERGARVLMFDPLVETESLQLDWEAPMVFLIGTKHKTFEGYRFPPGSIVLDPWRYIPAAQPDVRIIPIGRGPAIDLSAGQTQPEQTAKDRRM